MSLDNLNVDRKKNRRDLSLVNLEIKSSICLLLNAYFLSLFHYNKDFLSYNKKTVCDKGWYGVQCREQCGHCRDSNQCLQTNGTCLTGCMTGYSGDLCKTREYMNFITILLNNVFNLFQGYF